MKKRLLSILTGAMLLAATCLYAQAPQGINYQAVVRDGSGSLMANASVTLRFTINQTTATGTTVYQETQSTTTNAYGLVTAVIGSGTPVTGTLSGVSWGSDAYFLKVEVNPGSGYADLGTTQFESVPYALSSADGNWTKSGIDIMNSNSGNVGIGVYAPNNKLQLSGDMNPGLAIFQSNSGDYFNISVNSAGQLQFGANGATISGSIPVMTLDDDNYSVGIGTLSPKAELHVKGIGGNADFFLQPSTGTGWNLGALSGAVNDFRIAKFDSVAYTDYLTITAAAGNVGIGTTTPAATLHVTNATSSAVLVGLTGGTLSYMTVNMPTASTTAGIFRVRDNGSSVAYFDNLAATYQLTVYGDAYASGGTWTNSDRQLKHDINHLNSVLPDLMKLNPVSYYFNTQNEEYKYLNLPVEKQFGLLAQEVKQVFPNVVRETVQYDEEGKLRPQALHSMNYTELVPIAIKAIQEQQQQIDVLRKEIEELKNK